ncbi:MAG: ElyC/SanA/YdcF family protein [Alphaproteobacteria bacterium]|jgi:hypothetical protein|nr:MAG: hypothetical protein BHW58_09435 [Azospirillum sp. 51_20]
MNNEKKDYQAAVLVHECLRARTDCFGNDGKIVKTAYIVCIDDDPDSAIHAVRLAKQHFAAHGFFPKMLCVGNKGLLSRWTHKTTEGAHLKNVCVKTGFPEGMAVVLDKGRNSGENILEIRAFLTKEGDLDKPVLFCCTKRLSLRLQLTQQKQAPEINARWYVIEESLDEACKWYNGKRFGHCTMMYHELASILNRCEAYAGTFQAPVPFPVPQDVKEAAARLEKRYRLKLPHKTFRSYIQFVLLLAEVMLHRKRMKTELEKRIESERIYNRPTV